MFALSVIPQRTALVAATVFAAATPAHAQREAHAATQASNSAAVAAAVHAYNEALSTGDTATVAALLAEDVHIAESGGVETRAQYMSHHLPGDMAFAAAVARTSTLRSIVVVGDIAWAMSSSLTEGSFRDREIDSQGAELMVLSRENTGWRIRAIHWSSRQRR